MNNLTPIQAYREQGKLGNNFPIKSSFGRTYVSGERFSRGSIVEPRRSFGRTYVSGELKKRVTRCNRFASLPTLADLDTTKKESYRVQLISFLPDGGDRTSSGKNYHLKSKAQNEQLISTAERIAEEHKVGRETVKRAEKFVDAVDTIAQEFGTLICVAPFRAFPPQKKRVGVLKFACQTPPEATSATFGYC